MVEVDDVDAAAILYGQLAPYDRFLTYVGTACEGPIAHYLGGLATVLGRFDDADRHLATATELAQRAGSPFYAARTLIERGRLAARRGARSDAGDLLTEGRDLARQWGFVGEEQRAAGALLGLT